MGAGFDGRDNHGAQRGGSRSSFQWQKWVMGLLFLVAILGAVYFMNKLRLDPEVIVAQAQLAQSNAVLSQAREPIYAKLPSVLTSAAVFAFVLLGSLSIFSVVAGFFAIVTIHKVDTFVSHGPTWERTDADGRRTRLALSQSNPAPFRSPRISVEKPENRPQLPQQGRRLSPEERQAPGKNPRRNGEEGGIPMMFQNPQQKASQEDPLASLDETRVL